MPVHKVGKDSYQWGTSGKIYKGKGAKEKAEKQGRAVRASGWNEDDTQIYKTTKRKSQHS